jgi:hypothetical protein
MTSTLLYALCVLALLSGPICGGIQWHHWNRLQRRRDRAEKLTAMGYSEVDHAET